MKKHAIRFVQAQLNSRNLAAETGKLDGYWGPQTDFAFGELEDISKTEKQERPFMKEDASGPEPFPQEIPILVDDVKTYEEFEMTRCTYFSIECDLPSLDWRLEIEESAISFFLVGLSGIITRPMGDHPLENERETSPVRGQHENNVGYGRCNPQDPMASARSHGQNERKQQLRGARPEARDISFVLTGDTAAERRDVHERFRHIRFKGHFAGHHP